MARQLEYELEGLINDANTAEQDEYDIAQHDSEPSSTWDRGGLAEGAGDIGSRIKSLYQKIYAAGDDAVEFAYYDSPIFAQYWDDYEGDLGSIIAEVDPSELEIIAIELESAVEDQGLEEGIGADMAKLIGIPVVAGAAAIGAQHYDDQQPHVEVGGQRAKIVRADSSRIPDSAMILTGKDGKKYKVWQQSGKGMNKMTLAAPADGVEEAQSMGGALRNALSRVEPGSKLDKKIRHHNDMARRFGKGTMDSAPDGYHMDRKGMIRLGDKQGVAEGEAKKAERPEADYGDDYQAMVSRVKKLAGMGPLKTVYDPQKRVYKNVPTAVQPKK